MSLLFEVVIQFVLDVVAFGIGRIFVFLLLPWYGVEPLSRHDPDEKHRWKWRGFAYAEGGRRYLRLEAVQLIGVAIIVALAVLIAGVAR